MFIKSSIGKKIIMALSAIFLIIFLLQHFLINITSVFSPNLFNHLSHFMGINPLVQFILQPILIFGIIVHFVLGFVLEYQNRLATNHKYSAFEGSANSSWSSRNMIWSGLVILAFLILHFIDFWIPEMAFKYIEANKPVANRYYDELVHKFENPIRVILYCISFILLAFHLNHGFTSAFKSLGVNTQYAKTIKTVGKAFSLFIPIGFCFISIFHYVNSL